MALVMQLETWKIAGWKDVPSQPACTSVPQQWDKPRGKKITPEPVSNMVISQPSTLHRKRRPVMPEFSDNRKIQLEEVDIQRLKDLTNTPISYLVQGLTASQVDTVNTAFGPQSIGSPLSYHAPLIQTLGQPMDTSIKCGDLVFPKPTAIDIEVLNEQKHHWSNLAITQEESVQLEKQTRSQAQSNLWFDERKKRITASNFGAIIKRKKDVNSCFIKNTFEKNNFVSAPTSYGRSNESVAKHMYSKKTGYHIHDVGLIVNPSFSFLGATPDAIVCDGSVTGLLEIKCPYSVRDLTIIDACNTKGDFFLKKSGDKIILSRNHQHWFQVQGQLLVTGAPYCDFVTFTRQDLHIERILPDHTTMDTLLNSLSTFFVKHFKPYFTK